MHETKENWNSLSFGARKILDVLKKKDPDDKVDQQDNKGRRLERSVWNESVME